MVMSPYRYTSHFSLRHLSFNLNREVVVVGANNVVAADPVIQHANTPNELLVLEIIDEVISSHRLHTVPNRIVSTTRSKTTTTRHLDANTLAAPEHSGDEEYEVTTIVVATMVQPSKGTVNDITVGSATGAVDTHIATYQTACIQCRSKHCAEYGDDHEDERRVKFFQKPCARYIVTSKTSTASEPLSVSTTSAARKRGGTRRPPLPPLLPLPSLSTGGRGGARHEAHPAPPRCFFSRRGGTVADATVDHQHLFLELRLPLLLLLRLLHQPLCRLLLISLALQERLRQEELHSRGVQGVATTQNRLCEEVHRGSHVTDRGCLLGEWRIQ